MKIFKFFSIAAVAALLLVPATVMAKTNFSISLNLFDCLAPMMAPRPIVVAPIHPPVYYYVPRPQPIYPCQPRTIVKEYHYYHQVPQETVEEINPSVPYYKFPQQR